MRNPFRLLTIYRKADAVIDVLDDGAKDDRLYHSQAWWSRLVTAAVGLINVLPLAAMERSVMNQFLHKFGIILGAAGVVVGAVDPHMLATVSPQAAAIVTIAGTAIATISALFHKIPGATDQPAR